MERLRILVADDSQFIRMHYRRILETQPHFEVVGIAADGEEALEKAIELAPDVAILDVRMPKMNGIEVAHRIARHHPGTAMIIVSAYDELAYVMELLKNGPERKAYLLKNTIDDVAELIRVVEAVVADQTVLDPSIVQKLVRLHLRQSHSMMDELTETEATVLELVAGGYDDEYIASVLDVESTVIGEHTKSIYQKLDLPQGSNQDLRAQAVVEFVNRSTDVTYIMEQGATELQSGL